MQSIDNIVAEGNIRPRNGTKEYVHNVPLGESNVCVSINTAICHDAPLPIPNDNAGLIYVKDAINSFVAWPKEFVILEDDEVPCRNNNSFTFIQSCNIMSILLLYFINFIFIGRG